MSKFKVGDKVRIKKSNTYGCGRQPCQDCMPGVLTVNKVNENSSYNCGADRVGNCDFKEELLEFDKVNWKDLFENGGGN